jgi:hypothetical protein
MQYSIDLGLGAVYTLPKQKDVIKKILETYITSSNLKEHDDNTLTVEMLEEGMQKLNADEQENFKGIISEFSKEIINNKEISKKFYRSLEGWQQLTKEGSKTPNTVLIEYIDEVTLYEAYKNQKDYDVLRGWSGLTFGRDMEKIPSFDVKDWYEKEMKEGVVVYDTPVYITISAEKTKGFLPLLKKIKESVEINRKEAAKSKFKKPFNELTNQQQRQLIKEIPLLEEVNEMLLLEKIQYRYNLRQEKEYEILPSSDLDDYYDKLKMAKQEEIGKYDVFSGEWLEVPKISWGQGVDISKKVGVSKLNIRTKEVVDKIDKIGQAIKMNDFLLGEVDKLTLGTIKLDAFERFDRALPKKELEDNLVGTTERLDEIYLRKITAKIKAPKKEKGEDDGSDQYKKFENTKKKIIAFLENAEMQFKRYTFKKAQWEFSPYSKQAPVSQDFTENIDLLRERLYDLEFSFGITL